MREGVDYAGARPNVGQLQTVGATFACRYLLDTARSTTKRLDTPEIQRLNKAGIDLVSNFEYAVDGGLGGFDQGVADATTALNEIRILGIPRKVVYFSADWDIQPSQYPVMLAYLRGAHSVLGNDSLYVNKPNTGVYAKFDFIEYAYAQGFRYLWQTYAWSNGRVSNHATLYQYHNNAFPDWDGDRDKAFADDFGQWNIYQEVGPVKVDDVIIDGDVARDVGFYKPGQVVPHARLMQIIVDRAEAGKNYAKNANDAVKAVDDKVTVLESAVTSLAGAVTDIAGHLTQVLADVEELKHRPATGATADEIVTALLARLKALP